MNVGNEEQTVPETNNVAAEQAVEAVAPVLPENNEILAIAQAAEAEAAQLPENTTSMTTNAYLPSLPAVSEMQLYRNLQTASRVIYNGVGSYLSSVFGMPAIWKSSPGSEARKIGERLILNQILKYIQDENVKIQMQNIFVELQYDGLDRNMPYYLSNEAYKPIVSKAFNASLFASTKKASNVMGEALNVAIIVYLARNLPTHEEANYIEYTLLIALVLMYKLMFGNLIFTSPLRAFIDDRAEKGLKATIDAFENTLIFQGCVNRSLHSQSIQKTLQTMIDVFIKATADTDITRTISVLDDANTEWNLEGSLQNKDEGDIRYAYYQALYQEAYAKRVANELDKTLNSNVFANIRPFSAETNQALVFNTLMQVARSALSKQVKEYILTNGFTAVSAELRIKNAKVLAEKKNIRLFRYNKPTELLGMSASIVCNYKRVEHELLTGIAGLPYKDLARASIEYIGQKTLPLLFGGPKPVLSQYELMDDYIPRVDTPPRTETPPRTDTPSRTNTPEANANVPLEIENANALGLRI